MFLSLRLVFCLAIVVCELKESGPAVSSVPSTPATEPAATFPSGSRADVVETVSFLVPLRDLHVSELLTLLEQRDLLLCSFGCCARRHGSRVSIDTNSLSPDRKKATRKIPLLRQRESIDTSDACLNALRAFPSLNYFSTRRHFGTSWSHCLPQVQLRDSASPDLVR